jgi:ligand-binding SRPBCC domain-containing protein
MIVHTLHREVWLPKPLRQVFNFFSRTENLEKISPLWIRFRILTRPPIRMKQGAVFRYALQVRGIPFRWLTQIERWDPPHDFIDVQVTGPYKVWRHTHRFLPVDGGTSVIDIVQYSLPFGALGRLVHRVQVARDVERIFDYRNERIQQLFAAGAVDGPFDRTGP